MVNMTARQCLRNLGFSSHHPSWRNHMYESLELGSSMGALLAVLINVRCYKAVRKMDGCTYRVKIGVT